MILSIEKLNKVLEALLGRKALVDAWWTSPNLAFGKETPMNTYIGDPEKVTKYILDQLEAPH